MVLGTAGAATQYNPVAAPVQGFDPYSFAYPLWLDDHRVLVGMRPLKQGASDDGKPGSYDDYHVVVWDTGSNTVSAPLMSGMPRCVNPDTQYVQIDVKKDREGTHFRHGTWGKTLEEYRLVDHANPAETRYINPYSCQDHAGTSNKLVPRQVSDPLREDHGILHFDILDNVTYKGWFVLRLLAPDGKTAEFETTHAAYRFAPPFSRQQQSYVFYGRLYHRGEAPREQVEKNHAVSDTFSLLSPSSPYAIRLVTLPPPLKALASPPPAGKSFFPQPPDFLARDRILWHYLLTEEPERGTYLQEGGKVTKILEGHQGGTVSPDGCKFVYVRSSGRYNSATHDPRKTNRLEFIDFCKGDNDK